LVRPESATSGQSIGQEITPPLTGFQLQLTKPIRRLQRQDRQPKPAVQACSRQGGAGTCPVAPGYDVAVSVMKPMFTGFDSGSTGPRHGLGDAITPARPGCSAGTTRALLQRGGVRS